jgi:hypothetical protein
VIIGLVNYWSLVSHISFPSPGKKLFSQVFCGQWYKQIFLSAFVSTSFCSTSWTTTSCWWKIERGIKVWMISGHILGVLCFHPKNPTTNFKDRLRPHLYLDGSGIQGT